jgi:chitin synthase
VVQDKHQQVEVEVVAELPDDIYMEALENLRTRKPLVNASNVRFISDAEKEQNAKDYHANIRTNVSNDQVGLLVSALLIPT